MSQWSVEEQQEEDGSWSIVSTVLPGLVVGADTREEAWAMWPEAVESWASGANDARVAAERRTVSPCSERHRHGPIAGATGEGETP